MTPVRIESGQSDCTAMSAIGGKSRHAVLQRTCPLMTQSGHQSNAQRPNVETFFSVGLRRYHALS